MPEPDVPVKLASESTAPVVLSVENLDVTYRRRSGDVAAVKGASFHLHEGEALGIVGETGSGKTTSIAALLRLLPQRAVVRADAMRLGDRDLLTLGDAQLRALRGRELSLIPQRPMTSLSPVARLGRQLDRLDRRPPAANGEPRPEVAEMLSRVGLGPLAARMRAYPHEFSGGQLQRILIAVAALAPQPQILFADEPTATLDVTVQGQVLALLSELRRELGLSLVMITHDLGVVAQTCDRVVVMRNGEVVETAPVADLFARPQHPYTAQLLEHLTRPPLVRGRPSAADAPQRLRVRDVSCSYRVGGGFLRSGTQSVQAVKDVSLSVAGGETLALVGESGCGKSTLAKTLVGLLRPVEGSIWVEDADVTADPVGGGARAAVQLISQNPFSSLNRRRTIAHALMQALAVRGTVPPAAREQRAQELLEQVGLDASHLPRYASELSGGQLQRVAIARSLAAEPRILVLDEPTASLDVSVTARIVDLLVGLQRELDLTYVWITHEIDVARSVSEQTAVMYLGRVVEQGPTAQVLHTPRHPYTASLLASVPVPDPARRSAFRPLAGEVPSPLDPPSGCSFRTRCPIAEQGLCAAEVPPLRAVDGSHAAACHFADDVQERLASAGTPPTS